MSSYSPPATPIDLPAAPTVEGERPVPMTAFERRFKHPPGLFILFFAEMWERFSYYGMRGLLKLYMVNFLFVTVRQTLQGQAYDGAGNPATVVGWNFIKHLLPAADPAKLQECIGPKVQALMTGDLGNHIAGVSASLANDIATQTCAASGHASILYGWYTALVYFTPFFGGILADRWLGQRKTVVVGGVLMAIGHFVMAIENSFFLALGLLILGNGAFKPNVSTQVGSLYAPGDPRRDGAFTIFYMGINLGAFICNIVCGTLAYVYGWHYGFAAAGVGMVLGLCVYLWGQKYLAKETIQKTERAKHESKPLDAGEKTRVWALVILCLLNVVFWAVYEQQGNTMQSWADEKTVWPSWASSTWFQSVNPAFIFLLAPLFDRFWTWQNKRGTEPSSVAKMAIGCFIVGGSFIIMVIGAKVVGGGKGGLFWPIFCTFLLTVGELYLSPIGLSLVTKVAPVRIVSLMMGMWFLSSFFGNILSGYIGQLYTTMSADLFFFMLMGLGIAAGVAIWLFNKPLKSAMISHPEPATGGAAGLSGEKE
jgi:POT family proton-dependent oligopeptide transporter